MGRPPKHETRDRQLNLSLTAREYSEVCCRATAAGMRPSEFGRMQIVSERALKRVHAIAHGQRDPAFLLQLSRLGNNLNQITRRLHQLDIAAAARIAALLLCRRGDHSAAIAALTDERATARANLRRRFRQEEQEATQRAASQDIGPAPRAEAAASPRPVARRPRRSMRPPRPG